MSQYFLVKTFLCRKIIYFSVLKFFGEIRWGENKKTVNFLRINLLNNSSFKVNAVFAADAVARLSGKVGVAAVTAGPGNV